MKRIINGVTYYTKKAIFLGKYDAGFSKEDIRWSVSELYKTKSGKYFLYGAGGPASSYAKSDDIFETHTNGESIIPMSQEEVIIWANEYLPDYELETLYKSMLLEAKRLNLEVPPLLRESLRKIKSKNKERKLAEAKAKEDSKKNRFVNYIDW